MVSIVATIDSPITTATAHVGFFWFVKNAGSWFLVADILPLADAEPYGDCRTHPGGHYDLWIGLAAKGAAWLQANGYPDTIAFSEYEEHPRGRAVYDMAARTFVVYLDPRIGGQKFRASLISSLGLIGQPVIFRRDGHYRPPR